MDLKTYLPELLTEAILLDPLEAPWDAIALLPERIERQFAVLGGNYDLNGGIAIHRTAKVESGVVLKAPVIIGPHCFIAAHSYLRGGVLLLESARIGPGGEVKQSIIGPRTALAHFNFVGDSILGADVNMEAGAVIANHWNERTEREKPSSAQWSETIHASALTPCFRRGRYSLPAVSLDGLPLSIRSRARRSQSGAHRDH